LPKSDVRTLFPSITGGHRPDTAGPAGARFFRESGRRCPGRRGCRGSKRPSGRQSLQPTHFLDWPRERQPAKRAKDESPWHKPWGFKRRVGEARQAGERMRPMAAGVRGQPGAAASSAFRRQKIAWCNREWPLRAWDFRPGWPGLAERLEPIPRLAPVGFILAPASRADFAPTLITLLGGGQGSRTARLRRSERRPEDWP